MKRLITACLLIVFLTACLPLGGALPAAEAAADAVPEELRLMRCAQALYDDITSAYSTAQGYRIAQFNRKEFYRDRLAKADLYNFTYDYFINISSALFNIGWGFVTGDVSRMAGAVAGMYVDEAVNFVMDSLKATAPMTVKDYIYAQAHDALDHIDLGKIEDVMERAQNNGGKLVSYEDASELVYRHLANKMLFSTLGMASEYYNKQLNEGVDGAIRDLLVKISLSEVADNIADNHFVTSTLYDAFLSFEYEFLDGIGQQCNEPCVKAWITEQKEILSEYSKLCDGSVNHINLQRTSHPSWIADDAGRWTCVDGEPCELDVVKVGSTSSRLQLYFPGTGQFENAIFAGIDNRHRAVYLDTKNDAVLCIAGNGTELNLWVTLYGSGGGAEQSASFVRQEYAWAGHWVNTENPETVLDITSNGDGTLHLAAHFAPELNFAIDFEPIDYELLYFDTLEKPFPADMRIDGNTGMLEFCIWPTDDYSLPNWLFTEFPFLSHLDEYAGSYFFTTDNPPDLTKYGWVPYEEPDALSEEESRQLFARLSETPLLAASGAGAWEGRMKINADGSFTGYYYDADFETIYEVSFSGRFEPHVETLNGVYWMYVDELNTAQVPGKTAMGQYGETIIYDEPPFYAGDYLLLTLPGAPNEMIPEMVQGEIGGVFDEWEDYSRFITLTRLTDGWGFFADPADPPSYDAEPLATAAPTAAPTPVPTRAPMEGRVIIDDEYLTVSVLGKEVNDRPVYILRVRNNTAQTLKLAVLRAQVQFHESISEEFLRQDSPIFDNEYEILTIPAGEDLTRDLLCNFLDFMVKSTDDLRMSDFLFDLWDAEGRSIREYADIQVDWDPAASIDTLFTPIRLLSSPEELSEDPSLISVKALGTYLSPAYHEGVLCKVTNNSPYRLKIGASGAIKDYTHNFFFEPTVNGVSCASPSELRRSNGGLKSDWLEPGESAHMFVAFRVDGNYVENITSASILLGPYTPTEKKGIVKELGRYVCNLSFDAANPAPAPTATPVPTAEPVEKLPKNITRLPGGNLRYDDGLIAFEMEPDALPIVYKNESSLQIYPEGSIATVVNVAVPSPTEYIDCYDFIYTETQDRYLNSIHVGIVQFPEGTDAAEWVRSYDAKNKKSGYETVAGKTARYVVLQSNTGMAITIYMDKQFNVYKLFRYFIPLSGNRILTFEYYEYADPWRQASLNAVLNSLEIRDSLIFSPPENVPPTPAPTEEPTPVPEEPTAIPTAEPTPVPTEEPAAVPTETPAPMPVDAVTPPPRGLGWVGYWMAHDESLAEMIITDNWNGTLHAQLLCLPAGDVDATLTYIDENTMRFEHDHGYGSMFGTLSRNADGTLRLDFTGGEYFEDEEATEYQGYYIGGFTFFPAEYEDMWYQTPEDAASTPEDWLGDWTSRNLDQSSTLRISGSGTQLTVDLTLGSHHYTAPADMDSDTIISVYGDDGFCCMLLLNKKLGRIAMLEVGASSDDVYDLIGSAYYGTVIYDRAIRLPGGSDNLDAVNNVGELPPTLIMPVPTEAPKSGELQPIPGKDGYMQVPVSHVDATSYILGTGDPAAYAPTRMIDGDETTCWQFSTDATKPGEAYINFDFDSPVTLDEMWMKNGFWKITDGEDQYVRNSRPKKITIYIRYSGSDAFQKMKTVSLKDDKARKDWKNITLKGVRNVTGVRVRVDEIYKGTKFKTDVCISEIMFVQAVK